MKRTFVSCAALTVLFGVLVIWLLPVPYGLFFEFSFRVFLLFLGVTLMLLCYFLVRARRVWSNFLAVPAIIVFLSVVLIGVSLSIGSGSTYTWLANSLLFLVPESGRGGLSEFPYSLTKAQWKEDIQFLRSEFPKHHASLFFSLQRGDFEGQIDQLEKDIARLSDKEIAFEFCRIISSVKDGHTQVSSLAFDIPPYLESKLIPLRVFHFDDGVYVTDGGRSYSELEGMRILKIGDSHIQDVVQNINDFVPGENAYHKRQWSFPYLFNVELLKYIGVIDKTDAIKITLADSNGKEVIKELNPTLSLLYLRRWRSKMDLDDLSRKSNLTKNYWFEYIDSTKTIFFQLNRLSNQPDHISIKDFCKRLKDFVAEHDFNNFVIDLRNCNGGDNTKLTPLLEVIGNSKVNRPGKLFVLIGRQTFSAGISLAAALERNTYAIFAGEPSGSGPNQCGDAQTLILPNSKLIISISSRFHQQSIYKDHRLTITPTLLAKYHYHDWAKGIDPALEMIYKFKPNDLEVSLPIDPAKFKSYTGRFKFDEGKLLTIKEEKGELVYDVQDFLPFAKGKLELKRKDEFLANNGVATFHFFDLRKDQFNAIEISWKNVSDTILRMSDGSLSSFELMQNGEIDRASAAYIKAKNDGFIFSYSTEQGLLRMGYEHLEKNDYDNAIRIFELMVILFPSSANAWDSLGETWLKKGDVLSAKIYYRRSLELNPENNQARKVLKME